MTGNFGMNVSKTSSIGFAEGSKNLLDNEKERLITFCEKAYGKEFINRVDSFVPFIELTQEEIIKIVDIRLSEFTQRINHKNIKIIIKPNVSEVMVRFHKDDHGMNAMAIDRIISKQLQPLVADTILELEDLTNYKYTLTIDTNVKNGLAIRKRKRKIKP